MADKALSGIQELNFSNVIGDRFGRYSKYIIQDRALPDIRDGLKPVQRRILYAMFSDGNSSDKPYRKSAKTVGNVIGNFHPHGDSSVYEAMVRMAQDWKNRIPLIDMHGNKGSMDGDPAAAMRYTEARLSPLSMQLLADIHSDTVDWILNFDDTQEEPQVLPARFPNLLVNGSTGISAGYATDIPPHNLYEVIDAIIYCLNQGPDKFDLKAVMKILPGPDFPTGGILQGKEGIEEAYRSGQGKVVLRAKTQVEDLKAGKSQIVISEIPYDVNKSKLIQKIDDIRISRKIEGIADVRDDSDRDGVSIVVELKKDTDPQTILNYLLKNTDLQINYHFNMVAIDERRPVLANLQTILFAYIRHQREILTRRSQFELNKAQARLHIVDGLIRLVSILDEVIATIRASDNKADAKAKLVADYDFSQEQAEAILSLQLYRLSNTDIVALQNERLVLNENIMFLENILAHDQALNQLLIRELKDIKKAFPSQRLTKIEDEVEEIVLETRDLIAEEQVIVSITKQGYMKRTSLRSFQASDTEELAYRDLDYPLFVRELSTHDQLVIITSRGNYIHLPVHELADIRWKDMGVHWSQVYQLEKGEQILAVFVQEAGREIADTETLTLVSKRGKIKQTALNLFTSYRSYKTRTATAMVMQDDEDEVIAALYAVNEQDQEVVLLTHRSFGLRFPLSEVSQIGLRAQGVNAINLKDEDYLVSALLYPMDASPSQEICILTDRGNIKRMSLAEISQAARASRGTYILKELKSNPHRVLGAVKVKDSEALMVIHGDTGYRSEILAKEVPLTPRVNNGSVLKELDKLGKVIAIHPARLKQLDEQ